MKADEDLVAQFMEKQIENLNLESSQITLKEAIFGKKYGPATWTCFLINMFN